MKANLNKIFFFGNIETLLLSIIAATIPLQINIGNFTIIISACYALFILLKKKVPLSNFKTLGFLIPVFLFLFATVSALSSKFINEGLHQLEKLILMFLVPFIVFTFKSRKINPLSVVYSYCIVLSLATALLLIIALYKVICGLEFEQLFFFNFTNTYNQHPVYFSTNIVLGFILLCHYSIIKKIKLIPTTIVYLFLIILFLGLLFCASKAVLAIFFIMLLIYIVHLQKKKLMLLAFFIALLGILSISFIKPLKVRFSDGLALNSIKFEPTTNLLKAKQFTYKEKVAISDIELRAIFFKIGLYHLINDNKFFLGYGLGDTQYFLDYYYMTYSLAPNWFEGFNLHNQYLQYLVTFGIFMLLILMFYLVYSISFAINKKHIIHTLFMIMVIFIFIFEVYLVRNKGIIFFFFFNTFFLTQNFKFENSNYRHTRNT